MLVLGIVAVVAAVALLIALRHRPMPQGWTAGPIIDGHNYSSGVSVDATGSFAFPLAPNSVHDVTKACGSIDRARAVTLKYRIDADPGVQFLAASDGKSPAIGPTLYFQRAGDDWSGAGQFETYRWWATFAAPSPITSGAHEITAMFSDLRWTAVETSDSQHQAAEFIAALKNAARVGFTFGGGTGYAHGVFATGKARFTVLEFAVE